MFKSWLKSKTIIVNSLVLDSGLLAVLVGSDLIAEYPQVAAACVSAAAAVNIVLRFFTNKAVK